MQENDILDVNIEDFTNLGCGIARIDNFVIFVDGACPDDVVKIKLTKVHKTYANAKVLEVIKPSEHRITPFCPMQKICGACQIQFIDYDYQIALKQKAVLDTIKSIYGKEIKISEPVKSPQIKNYRCKIQYPVSQKKGADRILAGYYKPASHEIVNIKYCPIQPEICDKIIDFIRESAQKYKITGYNEKTHSGDLRHIVIRHSSYDRKNLVVLIVNSDKIQSKFISFAKAVFENFNEVIGVSINYNPKKTNVIFGNKTECVIGDDHINEKILDKIFEVGAETFFQVNPQSAENIFRYVKDYLSNNFTSPDVLDAYAGISAFGIVVSDVCKKVVSIEENTESCKLAKKSVELNNIKNVEINNGDASEFLQNEKRKFDAIILDPPRKGCTQTSLDNAIRLASKIIYVSCNPVTLARDLKYLAGKGCDVESIQPFDMFCHTYHIENVAIISTP